MSDYIVSARKYRPDTFESLIGQDNIAKTLKNSILRGQLAHAYLFCGPRGVGKTSAARIFAKTINCSNPGPDLRPCGECESCRSFAEGRSYCIHELDAASNNGVDDIKALMEQVLIPPQTGKYSVFIIDEVHMLSSAAFNAFLKTLEEPPAHAIFILATTEKHKIIPTILSRCQTYDFNRIGIPDIVRNLRMIAGKEGITIDDESLHIIAQKADGAMRDALTIFDQTVAFCGTTVKYEDVLHNLNVLDYEYSFRLVDAFLQGDYATAMLIFDEVLRKGFNALYFVTSLATHLRDLLVSRTGGLEALLELPESLKQRYAEQSARCSVNFLYSALEVCSKCEAGYRASSNQRLHIEFALMRMAFMSGKQDAAVSATQSPKPVAPETQAGTGTTQRTTVEAQTGTGQPAAARRTAKKASTLSLSSLMSDAEGKDDVPARTVEVQPTADSPAGKPAAADYPSDESIASAWQELAASYASQPRLSNALSTAKLECSVSDEGYKLVTFSVLNDAQKRWIEEKMLRGLEDRFCKILSFKNLRLQPVVAPDDVERQESKYMPSEKAEDLMKRNPEVKNLIVDLGLDVK